ncbi:prepilin-type N-terminal cleavage/methylation domain-containing protein [Patescibacteria group bacterium]
MKTKKVNTLKLYSSKLSGFSYVELMVVIAILAILLIGLLGNYFNQIKKGQDAKRKKDLNLLRTALEDYSDDNNQYPDVADMVCGSTALSPWIKEVPCEPGNESYLYQTNGVTFYRIYTQLSIDSDPAIEQVGCDGGCPNAPSSEYNYGITSGNVAL